MVGGKESKMLVDRVGVIADGSDLCLIGCNTGGCTEYSPPYINSHDNVQILIGSS